MRCHSSFQGNLADTRAANLQHPVVRAWAEALMAERRHLWESRGLGREEVEGLEGLTVGSLVDEKLANGR